MTTPTKPPKRTGPISPEKSKAQLQFEAAPSVTESMVAGGRRRVLKNDRAVIQHEVAQLRRADISAKERDAAEREIANRVTRPLGIKTDAESRRIIATVVEGLSGDGSVGALGIRSALKYLPATKKIAAEDIAKLPPALIERLDKLV